MVMKGLKDLVLTHLVTTIHGRIDEIREEFGTAVGLC